MSGFKITSLQDEKQCFDNENYVGNDLLFWVWVRVHNFSFLIWSALLVLSSTANSPLLYCCLVPFVNHYGITARYLSRLLWRHWALPSRLYSEFHDCLAHRDCVRRTIETGNIHQRVKSSNVVNFSWRNLRYEGRSQRLKIWIIWRCYQW